MSVSFRYEARGPSGRIERGVLSAETRGQALERLRRRNLTPFALHTSATANTAQRLNDVAARDLSRALAQLLRAGLPFAQALKFAGEELPPAAAQAALRMHEAAERGEPASSALEEFSGAEARLLGGVIAAGEVSGRLSEALEVAAQSFGRSAELRARMTASLIYPCFVIAATLATLACFMLLVVPTLGAAFEGAEARLPQSTLSLLHFSAWLRGDGGIEIALTLAIALALSLTPSARRLLSVARDQLLLSPAGLGVANRLAFSAFASLASLSLQAGVPGEPHAFETAAKAQRNHIVAQRLHKVAAALRLGERPSLALDRLAQAPPSFVRLTRLGEETGRLGKTLKEASALLASEAEQRLARLGAIAGPVVTLVLGGLVASVVMSLFLGLLALSDMALA